MRQQETEASYNAPYFDEGKNTGEISANYSP